MSNLMRGIKKENQDPRIQFNTTASAQKHNVVDQFEIRSVKSDAVYSDNVAAAMSMEELDRLKEENLQRIRDIEARYFQKKEEAKPVVQMLQEKADKREVKEKRIDSSLSYPTYGRQGLDPKAEFDSYMINQSLCNEHSPSKGGRKQSQEKGK